MKALRSPSPPPVPEAPELRAVAKALLAWYPEHRRDLPWRRASDPYAVWVSEVMLQQTQVATVRGYYERWMKRFPTVRALAEAREDDVLHAWQGLGYYSRARNLHRGAQQVLTVHDGAVPRSPEALCELPGVGPYSAGAIASIAYGERAALVDGNVIRVLCRLFGLRGDPARAPLKAHLWALASALVPAEAPGDFNQSLMELGATVCTPRAPRCVECPLRKRCVAFAEHTVQELPETAKRAAPTLVARVAWVSVRRGNVLVVRVPDDAPRWAGMWQFPNTDVAAGETPRDAATRLARETTGNAVSLDAPAFQVKHTVTRYRITLDVFQSETTAPSPSTATSASKRLDPAKARWIAPEELGELALPAAHRRIADRVV